MNSIIIATLIVLTIMLGRYLYRRGARRAAAICFLLLAIAFIAYLIDPSAHRTGPIRQFRPRIHWWR